LTIAIFPESVSPGHAFRMAVVVSMFLFLLAEGALARERESGSSD